MEKRWTRKKRASREAGGPAPKPALTGPIHLAPERETPLEPEELTPPETPTPADVRSEAERTSEAAPSPEAKPRAPATDARPAVAPPEPVPEPAPAPAAETPEPDQPAEPAPPPRRKRGEPGAWAALPSFHVNARKLERNRIITATREDPVHSAFDVLRTKLLRALRENGWTRVAITSPTEGCGKTFLAANLAISLSRQSNCRSVLLDLDMRHPTLDKVLNIPDAPDLPAFLRGNLPLGDLLRRPAENDFKIGDQVAFGVNARREPYAAELLQDPDTAAVLSGMEAALAPDVVLFDMPPALVNDDVLAARPLFDGIILVVGGGITKPQQVRDVERRLGTETPLLGVVLNRSEGEAAQIYSY